MDERPLHKAELEHLFSYRIRFRGEPEVIGQVIEGLRVNVYYAGGTVNGPRVSGMFRPVGAGRAVLRPDGIATLDSRATIETDDGALIEMHHDALIEFGEDGFQNALRGDWPDRMLLRGAPRYESADPRYAWLSRLQCIAVGDIDPSRTEAVQVDVYAVK
jgi:hypothetical protein